MNRASRHRPLSGVIDAAPTPPPRAARRASISSALRGSIARVGVKTLNAAIEVVSNPLTDEAEAPIAEAAE
jgi:hypothetical protein